LAFYTDLSDVYDALFPVSEAQRALFDRILATGRVRRVADAGCGSGAQLLPFASAGVECVGFDPDPALVALAKTKLAPFPGASVEIGGFADISRIVSRKRRPSSETPPAFFRGKGRSFSRYSTTSAFC
jgi:SAM-dependent methyltransferase